MQTDIPKICSEKVLTNKCLCSILTLQVKNECSEKMFEMFALHLVWEGYL